MLKGDWFITNQGRQIFPFAPDMRTICIEDIAHALANQCRFGGHCKEFYSVAQHSTIGAQLFLVAPSRADLAMQFLLHDAAEAYIVDLPKPLKKTRFSQHPMGWLFGKIYQRVEHKFEEAIAEKFHLEPFPPAIKMMDNRLLVTEKRDLLSYSARAFKWAEDSVQKLDTKIIPLPPREAEMQYLDLYYELKARLGR